MYKQLIPEQRYTISCLLHQKKSLSFIASSIQVNVSSISREIHRNSVRGVYNDHRAQRECEHRKSRNHGNHKIEASVWSRVLELIRNEQWSPEQVSGRLRQEGIAVSKSAIYNHIRKLSPHYQDSICRYLRHGGRRHTHPAHSMPKPCIADRVSIEERPVSACGRVQGDWEPDTIVGKNDQGAIVTLVDRKSRYMLMDKMDTGKQAQPLAHRVVELLRSSGLPVRSITTDNGTEFASHKIIEQELHITVYFAHPYSPWEKGAIENTNGLIRQYIPKGTDFRGISHHYVKYIEHKLNHRPRKVIGFKTPDEVTLENIT